MAWYHSRNVLLRNSFLVSLLLVWDCSALSSSQTQPRHHYELDRRSVLMTSIGALGGAGPASAASESLLPDLTQAESAQLPNGLLEARVKENVLSPPPYGMESADVYYPAWFSGSWKVYSECTSVEAPCGPLLFGGNATFEAAKADVGPDKALKYQSRFILSGPSTVIADREFNVKSIAKVAMGENSVVDVSLASPNKFSCLLSPNGSPNLLTVDLLTLNRRQEVIDELHFDCSEVVREIVSPVGKQSASTPRRPQILKEIETTSLYTAVRSNGDGGIDQVRCLQRSAAFLLPSQQDPMALRMWEISRGRPIDVRFYDVTYTRK